MLSIIICHRNKELLQNISHNIKETVGVPYELIVIDNTENQYTIFSAYNEGVRCSKFDIICFTHEDITYHTQDWGLKIMNHFSDDKIGMIGVNGSMLVPNVPSAWWYSIAQGHSAISIIETRNNEALGYYYQNPLNRQLCVEAKVVDGLWFCIRRSLFDKISFDEQSFHGFHGYDIDISLQAGQYAKIMIIFDVLLQHYSGGTTKRDYYETLIKLHQKWCNQLPVYTEAYTRTRVDKVSWYHLRRLLIDLEAANFTSQEIRSVKKQYLNVLKKGAINWWHFTYFIVFDLCGQKIANGIFERMERLFSVKSPRRMHKKNIPDSAVGIE